MIPAKIPIVTQIPFFRSIGVEKIMNPSIVSGILLSAPTIANEVAPATFMVRKVVNDISSPMIPDKIKKRIKEFDCQHSHSEALENSWLARANKANMGKEIVLL